MYNLIWSSPIVEVHTGTSQWDAFCQRCFLLAGNTREGVQVKMSEMQKRQ